MTDSHPFDRITIDQLRAANGGVKWTRYPDMIGAFVAEMDFGTAPAVIEELQAAVAQGDFGYLPDPLVEQMALACAEWQHDQYGWDISPSSIHAVPDVIRVLQIAIEHFSAPGAVVVPTPAYMPFLTVPEELGRRVIEVPMRWDGADHHFDLDALAAAFADGGTLLVLCNPSNPLGMVFDRDELLAVSEVVEAAGVRVFADEVHAPFTYGDRRHVPYASVSPTAAAHSITGTSGSKAWNLAGLKCAQAIVTNEADALRWEQLPRVATHGTSNLGVIANTAAYRAGGEWLDGVLGYLDASRRLLADLLGEHLPAARYRVPDATYIAWLDLRDCGLGDHPAEALLDRAGLAVNDGVLCGDGYQGFVRLNFATPQPILRTIVERMAVAVSEPGHRA